MPALADELRLIILPSHSRMCQRYIQERPDDLHIALLERDWSGTCWAEHQW